MTFEEAKNILYEAEIKIEEAADTFLIRRMGDRGVLFLNGQKVRGAYKELEGRVLSIAEEYGKRQNFTCKTEDSPEEKSAALYYDAREYSYLLLHYERTPDQTILTIPVYRINKQSDWDAKLFKLRHDHVYSGRVPDRELIESIIQESYRAISRLDRL